MIALLKEARAYSRILAAHLISKIGDGMHELVFVLLAMAATDNNLLVLGWIYFFRFIPYLLLGPTGRVLADRYDPKQLMLWSDCGRGLLVALLAVLVHLDAVHPIHLAIIGMLITGFRTLFQPAFQVSTPRIVKAAHLVNANGMIQVASELGGVIGPAVAGVILLGANKSVVLLIDAFSYFISFILIWFVPRLGTTEKKDQHDYWHELFIAAREIKNNRSLFATIVLSACCIFFVGAILRVLIPAYAKDISHNESFVGIVMSIIALGTIVGAYCFPKLVRHITAGHLMGYWAIYGFTLILIPFTNHAFFLLALSALLGFVGAFVDIALPTNVQIISKPESLGKHFSFFSTLANTGEALSGVIAGVLVTMFSLSLGLMIAGGCVMLIGLLGARWCSQRT